MNNKLKLILYYLKLFLFSSLILLFTLLLMINTTILTENYHLKKMDKIYYDKLNEEIFESIKLNTMASQFDENIIHDYYDKKDLKQNVTEYMDYLFDKSDKKMNLANVENKIRNIVDNYLKENNINDVDDTSINSYVDTVLKIYEEKITVMDFTKILKNRVVKLHKIINIILIALLLLIILFIILVRKNIKLYIFVPLYMIGMLFVLLSIIITKSIDITYLTLFTYSISEYIRYILNNITNLLLILGITTISLSLIINILLIIKNEKKWNILEK